VGRRLSLAIAAAGLIVALGILALGRRGPPDDLRAAAADLDALIRENAAAVKERAETLAQLPRIGWAVATDEATVKDLTSDELAFRTHPGEHIEITQMRRGGGEPRVLLRRPPDSDIDLPLLQGTHVVVRDKQLQLVTVVSIEPRERAELMVGILAVAKQLDTSAIEQRLAARGINAEVRTIQGSAVLSGNAPASSATGIPLSGPAAEGVVVVGVNPRASRWPYVVAPLVLLLALAGAALLWRRDAAAAAEAAFAAPIFRRRSTAPVEPLLSPPPVDTTSESIEEPTAPVIPAPPPTPRVGPPPLADPPQAAHTPPAPPAPRVALPAPAESPHAPPAPHAPPPPPPPPAARITSALPSPGARPTPPMGAKAAASEARPTRMPTLPLGAKAAYPEARLPTPPVGARATPPEARPARAPTPPLGAKATPVAGLPIPSDAIPLPDLRMDQARSGRVDTSLIRSGSVALQARGAGANAADPNAAADPRTEEYRSLFDEFVKLRRTTGEPVDDLDSAAFVATLREKRAQIMKQIPVRDVKFKLAFHNGKAAIRYLTVN